MKRSFESISFNPRHFSYININHKYDDRFAAPDRFVLIGSPDTDLSSKFYTKCFLYTSYASKLTSSCENQVAI